MTPQPTQAPPPDLTPALDPTPAPAALVEVVYGGVCCFPAHPDADMHGLVRAIIRTRLFTHAILALARYNVEVLPRDLHRTWSVSRSAVEQLATLERYGDVLVSSLVTAYLTPRSYRLIPRALMVPFKLGRIIRPDTRDWPEF